MSQFDRDLMDNSSVIINVVFFNYITVDKILESVKSTCIYQYIIIIGLYQAPSIYYKQKTAVPGDGNTVGPFRFCLLRHRIEK